MSIAIYGEDDLVRLSVTYNGYNFNDPDADPLNRCELNTVVIGNQYDQAIDADPSRDGSILGRARRSMKFVRLDATLRATTQASLFDQAQNLAVATDPALRSYRNDTAASSLVAPMWGVSALDFSTPTADTTNYSTGLIPSRFYARPRGSAPIPVSQYTGLGTFFTVEFLVPDPVRYWQTASSGAAGTIDNSLATAQSWPTVTIVMSGAGSATYTLTRTGTYHTNALVLDLSGLTTETVTVDMIRHKIYTDSTETPGLYVSGTYFELEATSQTVAATNATNAATTIAWRRAFVA